MKKKIAITLPPVNYPVHVFHPVHASAHPSMCETPEDLERVLREGWYLDQGAMFDGRDAPIVALIANAKSTEVEDDRDDIDAMLEEETEEELNDGSGKKKTKKKKS